MRPGYGQLLFYATLLVVMLFNALMTGLTICHVLRKYPVSLRPLSFSQRQNRQAAKTRSPSVPAMSKAFN